MTEILEQDTAKARDILEYLLLPHTMSYDYVARAIAAHREQATRAPVWQDIETAPRDGTTFIGAFFNQPWSDSHLNGQIVRCWFQPEFGAFISSCREMTLAPGFTFNDGSSRELHSPEIEAVSHWMPLPPPPT